MYRSLVQCDINFGQTKEEEMKLIDFISKFPDEESCRTKLREYRERHGVVCPRCGSILHYWKRDKECFECKSCHYRQSLKANTVMHGSQLPVRYWFIAMHLLTSTKKSISASELQRQLGHRNYNPIWAMLHKLRVAMGTRDSRYEVSGMVEVDEGFFSTEVPEGDKVRLNVDPSSVIISDDSKSYTNFCKLVKEHIHQVIRPKEVGKVLPWVHIAISNAKRLLLNIYHDIRPEYLQNYLNEFCWKFNRRFFGEALFDRLMVAAVAYKNQFRYNI